MTGTEYLLVGVGACAGIGKHIREIDPALSVLLVDSHRDPHARITAQLLEAGIPIYLEKPMALTVVDADLMLSTAERMGTNLYVGHNMRHTAVVRLMKQIIDDGLIGKVQAIW